MQALDFPGCDQLFAMIDRAVSSDCQRETTDCIRNGLAELIRTRAVTLRSDSLPLPWIAAQTGWLVAEHGRQPWSIAEVLPVHLSTSTISAADVWGSLLALLAFYSVLLVIEMYLMIKFARLGPSSLHTGRYHFEQQPA